MYVLLVLYYIGIRWRICTRPIRRAQARHYCCCRRRCLVQVNVGKLSRSLRMGRGPTLFEQAAPTHAGSVSCRGPVLYRILRTSPMRERKRAYMERVIRCLGFSYGRTQHYIDKAFGWSFRLRLFVGCGGTPLEEDSLVCGYGLFN